MVAEPGAVATIKYLFSPREWSSPLFFPPRFVHSFTRPFIRARREPGVGDDRIAPSQLLLHTQ